MTIATGLDLSDLLDIHSDAALSRAMTTLPARILSYDATTQTCSAQPTVKKILYADDDTKTYEEYPVAVGVPVMWPRGGGYAITMPLSVGDHVLLVFSKHVIADWRSSGQTKDQRDVRHLSYASPFAIPGCFPKMAALTSTANHLVLGHDTGAQIHVDASEVRLGADDASVAVTLSAPLLAYLDKLTVLVKALTALFQVTPAGTALVTVGASDMNLAPKLAALVASEGTDLPDVPATKVKAK